MDMEMGNMQPQIEALNVLRCHLDNEDYKEEDDKEDIYMEQEQGEEHGHGDGKAAPTSLL